MGHYGRPVGASVRFSGCCSAYIRKLWMDHAGASSALVVRLMRTNFARTGLNVLTVVTPLPTPSAAAVHDEPSGEISTLYPRGKPGGATTGAPLEVTAAAFPAPPRPPGGGD